MPNSPCTRRVLNNAFTIVVLLLATTTSTTVVTATAETTLTISPQQKAAEIGTDAVFTCSDSSGQIPASSIHWNYTVAGNTTINNNTTNVTTSPRLTSRNGTLTIRSVVLTDAGRYTCVNGSGNGTVGPSALLVVYEMPDYVQYAIVLVAVIGALVLVAAVGQMVKVRQELVRRRRHKQKMKKSEKTNAIKMRNYRKPSSEH